MMDTGDNDDFNGQETVERKKKHTHIMSEVYIKTKKKKERDDINDKKANNRICMYTHTKHS